MDAQAAQTPPFGWILTPFPPLQAMGSIVDMILEGRHARIEEQMLAQRVTMDDMLSNAGSDGRLSIFFDSHDLRDALNCDAHSFTHSFMTIYKAMILDSPPPHLPYRLDLAEFTLMKLRALGRFSTEDVQACANRNPTAL